LEDEDPSGAEEMLPDLSRLSFKTGIYTYQKKEVLSGREGE